MKNDRMPLLLFFVGAIAFIALLLLYAYAPDLRGDVSSGADAASHSAVGFAGLKKLLDLSDIPTQLDRGVTSREQTPSLTILTPGIDVSPADWRRYDEHSPVLVILPKWITMPMPLHLGWVMKLGAWPVRRVQDMLKPIATQSVKQASGDFHGLMPVIFPRLSGLPQHLSGDIKQLQYFPGLDKAELFLDDPDSKRLEKGGVAVVVRVRAGQNPIYLLSDPDLMNNQGLSDMGKAQTALAIIRDLRSGNGPVRMDLTLDGMTRSPSLLKALFEPPFRGATICAFLAAVLMALHALARFGAPLAPNTVRLRGKRALASNTAELVRMMGREAAMAPRYLAAMRNLVLAGLATRVRGAAEQDALLGTLEKASGSDMHYGQLVAEAMQVRTGSDLLKFADKAHAWKGRITREHS
jgi:hypothetical protein